jgi:hypothetical protein
MLLCEGQRLGSPCRAAQQWQTPQQAAHTLGGADRACADDHRERWAARCSHPSHACTRLRLRRRSPSCRCCQSANLPAVSPVVPPGLAHEQSQRSASQRSSRRTGQCGGRYPVAAGLPRLTLGCQATFRPPVSSATRSNSCCALPHLIAPQGAQEGGHRRRYALPVPLLAVAPNPLQGLCGSLTLLHGGGCTAPTTGPPLSVLPPCKRLECTAAGLLRQGPASQRAPAGRPPRSDRQRKCRACQAGRGAGGPRSLALCVPGDRRRPRMPDAAQAWAGGQRGGSVPPPPLASRCAPLYIEWSFTAGLCAAGYQWRVACSFP